MKLISSSLGKAQKLRKINGNRQIRQISFKRSIPLLIMFIPAILYFTIFKYVPMLGLQIAFRDYTMMDGIWGSTWVGWENFRTLLSNSQTLTTIRNTLVLGILGVLVSVPVPILIALLFNEIRSKLYRNFVQSCYYLPHFLSWVVVGGIFTSVFALDSGIINTLTEKLFGIKKLRIHLSCVNAAVQIECAGAKAWFCLRKYYLEIKALQFHPEFYILHFTLYISARALGRRHYIPRVAYAARGGRGEQAFPEAAGSARGRRHARQNAPSLLSQIYKTP